MPNGYVTSDMIDFNDIWYGDAGIRAAVDMYREVDVPVISSLAEKSPEAIFKYGISEANGFQKLAPGQRPDRKNVVLATMYPTVEKYGYAVGTDLDTLRRSTGKEVMLALRRPMREDPQVVFTEMLRVMLTNGGTNNAGYSWYNGEFSAEELLTAPPKYQQRSFAANHTHFICSAVSGDIALADMTAVKETIKHHGHNGTIAALVNSTGVQELENLAAFSSNTIIRSPISDLVAVKGFGRVFELLGIVWHETEMIPDGYISFVEANQPEGMRPLVHFEPANIQGLNMYPGPVNDYPLIESFWDRWMGFKVWQRGAGVAFQWKNHSATYVNPTFI